VSEPTLPTAPTGWTFGAATLSDSQAPTTDGTVVITTKAATYTVSVTNSISRDLGALKITKTVQGGGSGFTGTFSVDVTCTGDGGTYLDRVITYPTPGFVTIMGIPTGNQCTVTEDAPTGAPTGYSWGTASITGSPALIAKGGTTEVGVTNVVTGRAKIVKTVNGQPPAAGQTFTFQLRTGASTSADGTVLEQKDTDASGNISFTTALIPGQTYQVCEWVMPAWNSNLTGDGPLFVPNSIIPPSLPNPSVNNMTVCADFTVPAGQTRTFTVENTPPPGGRALTIGFWKNWASCTASAQKKYNFLDWALALASQQTSNPPGGMVISAQNPGVVGWPSYASLWYLVLKGDATSTAINVKNAPGCEAARNLLDKTTVDGRKKMASDPLFNMTAQLVAAEANRFTGAGISGTTITNINRAVLLDGKYKFDGLTYSPKLTAADTSLANCLATQLDNYNNDRPVSSCP